MIGEAMTPTFAHRNFLLNLSLENGQAIASTKYLAPTAEGQLMEFQDVVKNWAVIDHSGCGKIIAQHAAWMVEQTLPEESDEEAWTLAFHAYMGFAVATIQRLQDEGLIQLAHYPNLSIAQVVSLDGDDLAVEKIDRDNYSYKDLIGHLDWEPDVEKIMREEEEDVE